MVTKKRKSSRKKKARNKGRPTKLTATVQKILVEAIEVGAYYETACALAGIDYQSLRNWMIRGEKAGKGLYFDFFESLTRAEAKNEVDRLEEWRKFMTDEIGVVEETKPDGSVISKEKILRYGDYRAIRDFLERRHRSRWGQKLAHELTGPDDGPIEICEIKRVIVDAK